VSICHCLACRRRTGGPFAQQARYPREKMKIGGQSTAYVRVGDEGPGTGAERCAWKSAHFAAWRCC
jgi:hypothetical protein